MRNPVVCVKLELRLRLEAAEQPTSGSPLSLSQFCAGRRRQSRLCVLLIVGERIPRGPISAIRSRCFPKRKTWVLKQLIDKIKIVSANHRPNFFWVKAHVGVAGNEEADKQAKLATRKNTVDSRVPRSHNTLKSDIRRNIIEEWQNEWASTTKGPQTHQYLPKVSTKIKTFHPLIIQFLSGHGRFPSYFKRFGITDNPALRLRNFEKASTKLKRAEKTSNLSSDSDFNENRRKYEDPIQNTPSTSWQNPQLPSTSHCTSHNFPPVTPAHMDNQVSSSNKAFQRKVLRTLVEIKEDQAELHSMIQSITKVGSCSVIPEECVFPVNSSEELNLFNEYLYDREKFSQFEIQKLLTESDKEELETQKVQDEEKEDSYTDVPENIEEGEEDSYSEQNDTYSSADKCGEERQDQYVAFRKHRNKIFRDNGHR
ncbi:hypothetical protein HNY73_007484 [Argiope bruennichi]|uniref:RNase H type-1 domain-containing protein n=1 Tax=Argiope bruennichi TaxID=94029 RepID=A0A8T0FL55_ARGBR|nr:hypothetical protein HNY73_007484 [Argiope bruennichi]